MRNVYLTTFLLLICLSFSPVAAGAADIESGKRTNRVIDELSSVTCDGERLKDCQSAPSGRLRDQINEWSASGWSRKKILDRVVLIYGDGILLDTPKRGWRLSLWLTPLIVLAAAAVGFGRTAGSWLNVSGRRKAGCPLKAKPAVIDPRYRARVEEELNRFDNGRSV